MGVALIKEFQCSDYFPTHQCMDEVLSRYGNLKKLLLHRFSGWVEECSTNDSTFSHQAKAVTYKLPPLKFFYESIRNGNGASLEAVWLEQLPLFARINKHNYKDEMFVHILNCVARWPKPVRLMVRQNRTVSVKGRNGLNVASDEFVEMCLVRPNKLFAKHQTTLVMLEKFEANLQLLTSINELYRKSFQVNLYGKISVPDSNLDRMKVCWFVLKKEWFLNKERKHVLTYPSDSKNLDRKKQRSVFSKIVNSRAKGASLVKEHYNEWKFRLFSNEDVDLLTKDR